MLFIHRLTEISSRMGLLACLGCIFDGFAIIYILSADWIISTIIFVLVDTSCFSYTSINCKDILLHFSINYLRQILFLPAYWKPFTSPLPRETEKNIHTIIITG